MCCKNNRWTWGEKFPKNPRNSGKIRFSGRQEKFHRTGDAGSLASLTKFGAS